MTLPQKNRITTREFKNFAKKGKRIKGSACSISYGAVEGTFSKIAVIVSAKTEPRAVRRNRIRRDLTSRIAQRIPDFRMPLFLIVRVHRSGDEGSALCFQELITLLHKSGMINR